MFAIALACAFLSASPAVTYQTGGAKVEAILRELSAQSGVSLHAGDRVRGEILILDVKERPLEEVMRAIADADGAEWKPDGSGYELTRSTRLLDAQVANEAAARTAAMQRDLANQLKTSLAPLTEKSQANLFERIAWRAAEALGPAALARVKSGTRVVYATDPHPSQRRWPGNFRQILQAYDAERPRSVNADKLIPNLSSEVSRALVAVSNSIFQGLTVSVYLYDAKGGLIDNPLVSMQPSDLADIEEALTKKSPAATGEPVQLSENANQFMAITRNAMAGNPAEMTPELVGLVLDPAKYDPLSFFVADAMSVVARRNSRSLVASVPDMMFLTGLFLGARGVTEDSIRRWVSNSCEIDETKPGWMIVRPRYPVDVRDLRVDREKMGAFYRTAWKNGGVRLSDLGAYIAAQPRRYVETLSPFYGLFCLPEITSMISPDSIGALRVYGTLTDEQRAALEAGKTLSLEVLRRECQAEVADWIFTAPIYKFGATYSGALRGRHGRLSERAHPSRRVARDLKRGGCGDHDRFHGQESERGCPPANGLDLGLHARRVRRW